MGVGVDVSIEDMAQSSVLINFTFEPKGTKRSISDIIKNRNITDNSFKELCGQEADSMVERKFLSIEKTGTYVFSKDKQGNYFWKEATFGDKIANYFINLRSRYLS